MKNGGTVLFDTRDAFNTRPGGEATPETLALRRMLATLDVPELEPVPRDHVLTKTFYLLDRFPGATPRDRPGWRLCHPHRTGSVARRGPATACRR